MNNLFERWSKLSGPDKGGGQSQVLDEKESSGCASILEQ